MDGTILYPLILGVVAVSLLLGWLVQLRRCRRLERQIEHLEQQFQERSSTAENFTQDLVAAERSQPDAKVPAPQGLPDRYRYINGMAEQGMHPAQIATILQMGEVEVAQIVRLSLLKKEA